MLMFIYFILMFNYCILSFYIKDNFDKLLYTDFIILLSIFIPIIHHEKKSWVILDFNV